MGDREREKEGEGVRAKGRVRAIQLEIRKQIKEMHAYQKAKGKRQKANGPSQKVSPEGCNWPQTDNGIDRQINGQTDRRTDGELNKYMNEIKLQRAC